MRVRVIRQFLNGRDVVSEGRELVVSDRRAKQLEANKLVVPIDIGAGERQRRAARQGAAGPTDTDIDPGSRTMATAETTAARRTGGRTGEATRRSSSRRGRPRKVSPSSLAEAERVT